MLASKLSGRPPAEAGETTTLSRSKLQYSPREVPGLHVAVIRPQERADRTQQSASETFRDIEYCIGHIAHAIYRTKDQHQEHYFNWPMITC